jgi:hypothetical protein
MILFTKLFLAHLIGDFLLQPSERVLLKEEKKQLQNTFIFMR